MKTVVLPISLDVRLHPEEATPKVRKFDPNEARDDAGKWTTGGGPMGHGYSPGAQMINGVIHTSNVDDAVRALYENKQVELTQPREVSTLIDKLKVVSARMVAEGDKAPNFNLCNVSVSGTNLFCHGNLGIPRIQMPQIDDVAGFKDYLTKLGATFEDTTEQASMLRATQNELNGAKVAGIASKIDPTQFGRVFVSSDNYVLDGHHRWAAEIALDAKDGKLGDLSIPVTRVNMKIVPLLKLADAFSPSRSGFFGKAYDPCIAQKFNPDEPRDDHGMWTDGGGFDSHAASQSGHDLAGASSEIARRMFPGGFDTSENAPNTFHDLVDQYKQTGRMVVYSGASDNTIFGDKAANYAFRAWHDATHLRLMAPFTPDGEHRVFLGQARDLLKTFGDNPRTRSMINVLHAEIDGQVQYAKAHGGSFPVNQRAFDIAYMANPKTAVSRIFKGMDDYSWGRLRDGMDDVAPFEPSTDAQDLASRLLIEHHDAIVSVAKYDPQQARDDHGRWSLGGSGSVMFVSPNLSNMNFSQAASALSSDKQAQMTEATHEVNNILGLQSTERGAVGAWADGAENTVISHIDATSFDRIEAAAAMTGSLANQKAVLAFQTGAGDNKDFLASFKVNGSLADIHEKLLSDGLTFHTLEVTPGGARVYVFGSDAETLKTVNDAGGHYGSQVNVEFGTGKFVGSSLEIGSDATIRTDAQTVYNNTIRSFAASQPNGSNIRTAWSGLRQRWASLAKALRIAI